MSLANKLLARLQWLRRSSMLRLSLLLSLLFAVGFAAAVLVALTLGQNAIERRVDTSLAALAAATTLDEARGTSREMILRAPNELQGLPRPFQRAADRQGGTVDLANSYLGSSVWRVLVAQDRTGTPVVVAVPLEEAEETQELLTGVLWSTAAVVIGLALAIGFTTGLIAQRRLKLIDDTLNRLAAGELGARTHNARAKDDLDDIATQLDVTAGELERLVTQTRHLSASIAHDLRTPLARLRAQLEMLPEGEARGAALEEASKLSAIFDTIMRVARIEAGQGREGFENVALQDLVTEMAETFEPVVDDAGKTLVLSTTAPATVFADRQMLVQVIANLIQNALVHGGDTITLFANGPSFGVADNGAGVPDDQFSEIIKPMVRLDAARSTQGSGLGLALVRAVAERHGAVLNLRQNQPSGLTVSLNFTQK